MKACIISSVLVVVLLALLHNNADAQGRYHRHYGRPSRAYVRYCPPPRPVRVYTQPVICYNPPVPPCTPRYNRHYRSYDRGYSNNNRNNGYRNYGYRNNYHRRY
ncbi:MAG: hypothetical protein H7257_12410 [Taibaiella sp.]|nr:hypothetical protein [Taibaiella sp.]